MFEYLSENIEKQSINSFKNSGFILTFLFSFLDFSLIIISLLNFNSKNKLIIALKSKLIKIFTLDIIIRLLYIIKYFDASIYKEIILSVMTTCQFYLIILFIDQIININKSSPLKISKNKNQRKKLCLLFFFLTFPYEKFLFKFSISLDLQLLINKIILIIRCICILTCLFKFYKLFKKKIIEIGKYLIKETHKKKRIFLFIIGSPTSCLFLLTSNYILNIIFTLFGSPIMYIYRSILLNIIKDTFKFFIFLLGEIIMYNLNKIKMKKELENKYFLKKKMQLINN